MSPLSWIIDAIPYWVWIAAAIVAVAMTWPMWSTLWLALPRPVKAVLVLIASTIVAYIAGRNRGFRNARERQKAADAQATQRRLETNAQVDRMPADHVDRELDKWVRD